MRVYPKSWNLSPLNEVCDEVIDCINKTAPTVNYPTEFKMIRTTNVKEGRINTDDVKYVDEKTFRKWTRRFTPKKNDVILTREAPLGEVGLLRSNDKVFLGQRTMAYRANKKIMDQYFLYYSFQGYTLQSQIKSLGSGSTVEHLRVPDAERLKIALPPLANQKKIAAILTAYDDLIEINKRRIQILEKMAEEIYREWFVRMRFPGYEKKDFIKGIPKTWKVKRITNVDEFNFIQRNLDIFDDEKEYYATSEINGIHIDEPTDFITFKNKPSRAQYVPLLHSIWFARMKNTYKVFAISESNIHYKDRIVLSSGFAGFSTEKYIFPFLYMTIKSKNFHAMKDLYTTGATQESLTNDGLSKIKILLPDVSLLEDFGKTTYSLIDQMFNLQAINKKLGYTKDLILPRLISGKLPTDNLDIQFPPSMEEVNA